MASTSAASPVEGISMEFSKGWHCNSGSLRVVVCTFEEAIVVAECVVDS